MDEKQIQPLDYATPVLRDEPDRRWQALGVLIGLAGAGLLVLGIGLIAGLRRESFDQVGRIIDEAFMGSVFILAGSWWEIIGFRWVRQKKTVMATIDDDPLHKAEQ